MVLVYTIDFQPFRHFVERTHFEEAEIGARNGQKNRNRTLTTDPGRFAQSQTGSGNDINAGSPGFQKGPTGRPCQPGLHGLLLGTVSSCSIERVLLTWTPRISLVAETSYCQCFLVG